MDIKIFHRSFLSESAEKVRGVPFGAVFQRNSSNGKVYEKKGNRGKINVFVEKFLYHSAEKNSYENHLVFQYFRVSKTVK